MKSKSNQRKLSKRHFLALTAGMASTQWVTPTVQSVILPAHAQTSVSPPTPDQPPSQQTTLTCEFQILAELHGTGGYYGYWELETAGGSIVGPRVGAAVADAQQDIDVQLLIAPPQPAGAALSGAFIRSSGRTSTGETTFTSPSSMLNVGSYTLYFSMVAESFTDFGTTSVSANICGQQLSASSPQQPPGTRTPMLSFTVDANGNVT